DVLAPHLILHGERVGGRVAGALLWHPARGRYVMSNPVGCGDRDGPPLEAAHARRAAGEAAFVDERFAGAHGRTRAGLASVSALHEEVEGHARGAASRRHGLR